VYFVIIWFILWSFGIFFPFFGILYKEKSGNPGVVDVFFSFRKSDQIIPKIFNMGTHLKKFSADKILNYKNSKKDITKRNQNLFLV
jgi:hypothetical protein